MYAIFYNTEMYLIKMKPWITRKIKKLKKNRQNMHDEIVNKLEQRLKQTDINGEPLYNATTKFEEYGYGKVTLGEVDLQARNNHYFLLFEIKTSHSQRNRKHAIQQLHRATEHYKRNYHYKKIFNFYVTKNNIEWIKE